MKLLRENSNTATTSDITTPTSLETYLRIYNKAKGSKDGGGSCYTNYMQGAKALYKFLSPIEIPTDIIFNSTLMPAVIHGYEVDQIAHIFCPSGASITSRPDWNMDKWLSRMNYISNLVVYYTAKHIMEEIIHGT